MSSAALKNHRPTIERILSAASETPMGSWYTLRSYRSKRGSVADHLIGTMSWRDVARASLAQIEPLTPAAVIEGCPLEGVTEEDAAQALERVRRDWSEAAESGFRRYYEEVAPGFIRHLRTGSVYLVGVERGRREIRPADPARPRPPSSLLRRWSEKQALAGCWRQFRMGPDNWNALEIEGRLFPREPSWDPGSFDFPDRTWAQR